MKFRVYPFMSKYFFKRPAKILPALFVTLGAFAQVNAQPTLNDCRELTEVLERYACYEQLEAEPSEAATGEAARTEGVRRESAVPVTPARPVSNLPVVARPAPVSPPAGQREAAEQDPAPDARPAGTARVETRDEEDKPFYKRLWPFGGDDDEDERPQTASAGPNEPASDIDSFGLENDGGDARVVDEDGDKVLYDTIAELKLIQHQQWQITLAGGQVWNQMISKRYMLEVGEEIKIYPSMWGNSYRLTSDRLKGFIQVERVQ